ncbi:MAG: FG-GAP repeat protein [bacterium]
MLSFLSFLLFPVLIFFGTFDLQAQTPAPQTKATDAPIEVLIRDQFGPHVEVAGGVKSTVLKGDFNGDGKPDIAVLVKPKGKRGELSPGVRLVQTAEGAKDPAPTAMLNGENSLAVIHGSAAGWQTPAPNGKFLIYAFGWIGWPGPQTGNLIVLPKSKQKRDKSGYATLSPQNFVSLPKVIAGDGIVVPTEAGINTFLYWNGKTYRFWVDPGETP